MIHPHKYIVLEALWPCRARAFSLLSDYALVSLINHLGHCGCPLGHGITGNDMTPRWSFLPVVLINDSQMFFEPIIFLAASSATCQMMGLLLDYVPRIEKADAIYSGARSARLHILRCLTALHSKNLQSICTSQSTLLLWIKSVRFNHIWCW